MGLIEYEPWKVKENLWKEKCNWGERQNKPLLASHLSQRTGKSAVDSLRDLDMAEKSGMTRTDADGSIEIE